MVTVGELNGESVATTISVSIPMLTNADKVRQGDELIMKAVAQTHANKRRALCWKDDVADAKKAKEKTAVAAKPKAKTKGSSALEIEAEV